MIFSWRKNKNYPDYWLRYADSFKTKQENDLNKVVFTVFDTETTGFDFKNDRILCIGALKLKGASIAMESIYEKYVFQEHFDPKTVHIHGLLKERPTAISEEAAIISFLDYLGNSVIVAHHAHFDVTMINYALKRLRLPKLKNRVLDTGILYKKTRISSHLIKQEKIFSLDELADMMHISKIDRHTALGDAYITAIVFLKTLTKLKKGHKMTLKHLVRLMRY
jgi:DNA polymerase-3 subunit epsilon